MYFNLLFNELYSINSKGFNFGNNIVLYISSFSIFIFSDTSIYISLLFKIFFEFDFDINKSYIVLFGFIFLENNL